MSKARLPGAGSPASLVRRRQLHALQAIEAAAVELLQKLKTDPRFLAQPGASAFPKKIFVTDEGSVPMPDGQSLAYLELVQKQWSEDFLRERPRDAAAISIRMLQQAVIDAHLIERKLIARLEALE
jgi:hypothetical protein